MSLEGKTRGESCVSTIYIYLSVMPVYPAYFGYKAIKCSQLDKADFNKSDTGKGEN